ncbi:enoyl-CoA hydratase [Mesorhizobium sp. STM 4661]|uniref:enoyl-CoA hydratase n=1 Tax=Mesorhizobium sp. STM 4661 TaxID=1297570 RepID=UPI0002BF03F3|nr:enoyl-CoA hydratase [Mesorhizobium sp. STM 4661]CCV15533.1 acyl-CoA hydratase [Mesorhizobium sp. STM 4661]
MDEIVTEHIESVLRVELNRPAKKNDMTSAMYTQLADIFNDAANDDGVNVVLWHGAGDSFTAGNDITDFLESPPGPAESPQAHLMRALADFDKPLIAAVRGVAIGGGTTMLLHCDFVYAGESTRFQTPFINLALPPEFGSSYALPARIGHIRAAELFLLGDPFGAARAAELGLVTRVVPDDRVFATAMETARKLAAKPGGALRASKRLLKRAFQGQVGAAIEIELREFSERLRSAEAKEALSAFLEKRPPNFTKTSAMAAE